MIWNHQLVVDIPKNPTDAQSESGSLMRPQIQSANHGWWKRYGIPKKFPRKTHAYYIGMSKFLWHSSLGFPEFPISQPPTNDIYIPIPSYRAHLTEGIVCSCATGIGRCEDWARGAVGSSMMSNKHMGVSENNGSFPSKSSIKKIGFGHDFHHPFWVFFPSIFGSTPIYPRNGKCFVNCIGIPSWELTYPPDKADFEEDFLNFPRRDMLISWRVGIFVEWKFGQVTNAMEAMPCWLVGRSDYSEVMLKWCHWHPQKKVVGSRYGIISGFIWGFSSLEKECERFEFDPNGEELQFWLTECCFCCWCDGKF